MPVSTPREAWMSGSPQGYTPPPAPEAQVTSSLLTLTHAHTHTHTHTHTDTHVRAHTQTHTHTPSDLVFPHQTYIDREEGGHSMEVVNILSKA